MARDGLSEAAARARVAAQMPLAEKRSRAGFVIENDSDLKHLAQQVRTTWRAATGLTLPSPVI